MPLGHNKIDCTSCSTISIVLILPCTLRKPIDVRFHTFSINLAPRFGGPRFGKIRINCHWQWSRPK